KKKDRIRERKCERKRAKKERKKERLRKKKGEKKWKRDKEREERERKGIIAAVDFEETQVFIFQRCITRYKSFNSTVGKHDKNSDADNYDHLCKKRKMEPNDMKRQAIEVCDVILTEISDRFKFTGHLGAAALFQPDKFPELSLGIFWDLASDLGLDLGPCFGFVLGTGFGLVTVLGLSTWHGFGTELELGTGFGIFLFGIFTDLYPTESHTSKETRRLIKSLLYHKNSSKMFKEGSQSISKEGGSGTPVTAFKEENTNTVAVLMAENKGLSHSEYFLQFPIQGLKTRNPKYLACYFSRRESTKNEDNCNHLDVEFNLDTAVY
ncbi:hypothetical protein C0J52_23202, partial [Blattella germanica]